MNRSIGRRNVGAPIVVWNRVLLLSSARLKALGWGLSGPLGPLMMHAAVTALLCSLVREGLPPFAYGVFALSLSGALVAIPLLGEFGSLLRADPTGDWVEALPVRRIELRLARSLSVLSFLALLACGSLVPAALLAPAAAGATGKLTLLLSGLEQVLCLAAVLIWLQNALSERAEGLLVALQTALIVGAILGTMFGLKQVPAMASWDSIEDAGLGRFVPSAWFAAPLAKEVSAGARWIPELLTLCGLALLIGTPPPRLAQGRRGGGALAVLLTPLRRLAARFWVRSEERATFELVFDALPRERDFVLRTYPLIGIPLAFFWMGARSEVGADRESALALMLFTTAAYLPILILHVPVTASPKARWLLELAPLPMRALQSGAIKAVAVRFIVPLYVALGLLTWSLGGLALAIEMALPAALLALFIMHVLYKRLVGQLPLSCTAQDVQAGETGGANLLFTLAIGLTLVSIFAYKTLTSIPRALIASAVLGLAIVLLERSREPSEGSGESEESAR